MDIAAAARIRAQVQGNIVEPYRLPHVRHVVVRVTDPGKARDILGSLLAKPLGERITSAEDSHPYDVTGPFVNVGFTFAGLQALGVPRPLLQAFPPEFRAGMVARAARLGDVGASGPEHWVPELRQPAAPHLMFTVHGADGEVTAAAADQVVGAGRLAFVPTIHFDGEALVYEAKEDRYEQYSKASPAARQEDAYTHGRGEHFGFRDGIGQPRFKGFGRDATPDGSAPFEPLGVVLLGHPTTSPVGVPVPTRRLAYQGTFHAFRVLGQDVAGFRSFIRAEAARLRIDAELLKAKLCGRWPNGTPLAAQARDLDDFDFSDDQDGARCPVGSHIRRANPRSAHIVQRPANRARRLVRRGMPFGPWLQEGVADGPEADRRRRGLLGSFLCASLAAQFEATQYDWLNLGLQDPSITSTNDPLVGANDPLHSRFHFSADGQEYTARGFPRFVETLGGAYLFVPGMSGLEWLAGAGWRGRQGR